MNLNNTLNKCMENGLRSLSQLRLMMAIERSSWDYPLRNVDLAEVSGIHPSNMTVMMRHLVSLGMVNKRGRLTALGARLIKPLLQNDTQ